MKYKINKTEIINDLNQETTIDDFNKYGHNDIVCKSNDWYKLGYKTIKVSHSFLNKVKFYSMNYINEKIKNDLKINYIDIENEYHKLYAVDKDHLRLIQSLGKLLNPINLGLDVSYLEKILSENCSIKTSLTCKNVCDLRLLRPYNGLVMDNNPLHRDTWLKPLNNCINLYIPLAGNSKLNSLSVIPGSHIWEIGLTEKTVGNARFNGVEYGLPSISRINTKYSVERPLLGDCEILMFSPNLIHGGAVNLSENKTRVSLEIRFWNE